MIKMSRLAGRPGKVTWSSVDGDDHVTEVDVEFDPTVVIREGCEVVEGLDVDVVALAVVADQKCHSS